MRPMRPGCLPGQHLTSLIRHFLRVCFLARASVGVPHGVVGYTVVQIRPDLLRVMRAHWPIACLAIANRVVAQEIAQARAIRAVRSQVTAYREPPTQISSLGRAVVFPGPAVSNTQPELVILTTGRPDQFRITSHLLGAGFLPKAI